ncbi:MAG: fibronectin type III domain-containing protein, partial [bacterium]
MSNQNLIVRYSFPMLLIVILVPLLLSVHASLAGTVTVSWDANTETDLAGYKIYYGKGSRNYQNSVYVGNTTTYNVTGLEDGERYYFAVTALDFSNNESNFSEEVDIVLKTTEADEGDSSETQTNAAQTLSVQTYNYPNPFKINLEHTTIRYELLQSAQVTIKILDANMDLITTLIEDDFKVAGEHLEDSWDGRNSDGRFVANGV